MGKHYFTDEQVENLRNNPSVRNVSSKSIAFESAFKEKFISEYESGKLPSQIFRENGLDPKVLGKERIHSFTKKAKRDSQRPEGFEDTRKGNSGRPRTKDLTPEEEIGRLKQQNMVLKQENDFLKGVRYVNRKQTCQASKAKVQRKNSN